WPPDRADQQAARHHDEGSRIADPQADLRWHHLGQGAEALDHLLPRQEEGEELARTAGAPSVPGPQNPELVTATTDTSPHRLLAQAATNPSKIAYQEKVNGRWQPTTWQAFAQQIRTAGRALIALGFPVNGKVAILGFNRPEWVILDHAAMMAGG